MPINRFAVMIGLLGGAGLCALRPVAAQVTVDWQEVPGGVSLAADPHGNVYTIHQDVAPGGDIQLLKRGPEGALLWQAAFDQTEPTRWEKAVWVDCDSDGNALVCGTSMSGFANPVSAASVLMKFSPAGGLLWRVVFDGDFDGSSASRCVVDAQGRIYVLGLGMGPGGLVSRVKAFDPDGAVRWDWFDAAGIGSPRMLKLAPDGNLLVSGRSITGNLNGYAKLDLDGALRWSVAGVPSLTSGDLAGDTEGNSYLIHAQSAAGGNTVVRKLDTAGAQLWTAVVPMSAFRVETGADGLPVVCGFPGPNQAGAAFAKLDAAGQLLWQNLDADGSQNLLLHSHLMLDSQGAAYLAAGTLFQMAVCKVDPDGASDWTAVVGSGSTAQAMVMGRAGKVLLTGQATVQLGQPWSGLEAPRLAIEGDHPCQMVLSWSEVPGASRYRVLESVDTAQWSELGTTTGLFWPLVCVPEGGRQYRVSALDE